LPVIVSVVSTAPPAVWLVVNVVALRVPTVVLKFGR
jgi:hypothetical protein